MSILYKAYWINSTALRTYTLCVARYFIHKLLYRQSSCLPDIADHMTMFTPCAVNNYCGDHRGAFPFPSFEFHEENKGTKWRQENTKWRQENRSFILCWQLRCEEDKPGTVVSVIACLLLEALIVKR